MTSADLVRLSALELARLIRTRAVSPVEVLDAVLARLERLEPRLNAFALVDAGRARAAARDAEIAVVKGEPLGPLHGVPVSVKDVLFTRGLRTTGGSRLHADFVPEEDDLAVRRLRAAGAVLLGKTTTPEFGHKAVTESPLFGVTRNPWDPDRTPGGSSGGAAVAVASGLGPIALGTDGGGSVRVPASFSGIYGFKPSWGRVPNGPGFPGWEDLGVTGPLTWTVRDAALVLDVIAGPDDRDRHSLPADTVAYLEACERGVAGLHVAWAPDLGWGGPDPEVARVTEAAAARFEDLGCRVEVVAPGWESLEADFGTVLAARFHALFGARLEADEALLDPTFARFVRRGADVTAGVYLAAAGRLHAFWDEARPFLERFDLLLTPTVAVVPFAAGAPPPREVGGARVGVLGWMPYTYPFNVTGQPAASVPAGETPDGLPVGLQIVGRRHADAAVLAASAAFELASPWTGRRPPLAWT